MKTRQDPERMSALLARREQQGWSWAELSRRTRLPVWKLRWWSRRLQRVPVIKRARETFVAVEVVGPTGATALEVVTRSGQRVIVPPGFDQEHLARLVQVLERSC